LKVYQDDTLVCNQTINIKIAQDDRSGIVPVCSFDIIEAKLWWPVGFGD